MPSSLALKHTADRTTKSRLYFCFSNTASLSIGNIWISAFILLDLMVSFQNNYFDFYYDHLSSLSFIQPLCISLFHFLF